VSATASPQWSWADQPQEHPLMSPVLFENSSTRRIYLKQAIRNELKRPYRCGKLVGFCVRAGVRKGDKWMFFRVMMFVWQFMLDLIAVQRMTDDEKDLEIMLLRQQLRIVERKQARGPQIPRWQKVPLAVVAVRLKRKASHSRQALEEVYDCSSQQQSSAGIGKPCDASGLTSRKDSRDVHPLMPNWSSGFSA
jgi:hypothetical protein